MATLALHQRRFIMFAVTIMLVAIASIAPASGQTTLDQSATDLSDPELPGVQSDGDAVPYIFDGFDAANPGWIVALFEGSSAICAGSLITDSVVLTAAHCVEAPGDFSVLIGQDDIFADGPTRTVDKIVIHPGWSGNVVTGTDIALLKLDSPIGGQSPVNLNRDASWPSLYQPVAAAGWGLFDNVSGPARFLQAAWMETTSSLDGTMDSFYCDLSPTQRLDDFCIGGATTSTTCIGDSGGPVMGFPTPAEDSGTLTLYGLVSYGTATCGFPFSNNKAQAIGPYVSWIDATVAGFESGPIVDSFIDDDDSIHEPDIEWLAANDITKGCNPPVNDRFCPKASVTRGQMAAFLRRALSLPSTSTDYFVDDNDSVFEGDINAVAAAGITKGCNPPANDRFCPDRTITREQMAAFMKRALDYPASPIDYFTDDNDSIFEGDINAIAQAGVTKGCNPPTNDRYCPTNLVTREQMASFMRRALE